METFCEADSHSSPGPGRGRALVTETWVLGPELESVSAETAKV